MSQNDVEAQKPWSSGLVLVTRPNCHLCADARDVVGRVASERGIDWREESVDEYPELLEQFSEEVPVVLLNGVQRDFWTIDEARLRRLLA